MLDLDPTTITLGLLLTTAGATTMAAFITGLVSVVGRLFILDGHEAQAAAVIALVLVLLLAVQAVVSGAMEAGIPLILAALFAWYGVTRLAMAIYDDITGKPSGLRG